VLRAYMHESTCACLLSTFFACFLAMCICKPCSCALLFIAPLYLMTSQRIKNFAAPSPKRIHTLPTYAPTPTVYSQGTNVRHRSKEICDLVSDTERIKVEREKVRSVGGG
jgi:hypothetical protein